jgi:hypothetical protein
MKASAERRSSGFDPSVPIGLALAGGMLLSGCGGDGGSSSSSPPTASSYTIDAIESRSMDDAVLPNNGGDNVTVSASVAKQVNSSAAIAKPLRITSSTPKHEAVAVVRTVQPVAVFSAALDATSVTDASISLSGGSVMESATYRVSGAQVTLQPQRKLKPLTKYTLTVGAGVRGLRGEILPEAVTRQFTTRDRAWGTAQQIEAEAGDATAPRVAASGVGNSFAVWAQHNGVRYRIWSSRYLTAIGWFAP